MRKLIAIFFLLLLLARGLWGQPANPQYLIVTSVPTSCTSFSPGVQLAPPGTPAGSIWTPVVSGGVCSYVQQSGGSGGLYVPLAGGSGTGNAMTGVLYGVGVNESGASTFGGTPSGNQFTLNNLSTIVTPWTFDITGPATALTSITGSGTALANGTALGTPSGGVITNLTGTCTACTANSSSSVANALTLNNGNSGAASGATFNGSAAVTLSANTLGAGSLANANSWSGLNTFSNAPTGSAAGTLFSGAPTTSSLYWPVVAIDTAGATAPSRSTNGTMLEVNAPSGFTGNLLWIGINGTQEASLSQFGALTLNGSVNSFGLETSSTSYFGFSSTTSNIGTRDTVLCRLGSAGVAGVEAAATCTNTTAAATAAFWAGSLNANTSITTPLVNTTTNCSSSASPAVCAAAPAGSVALPTNAVSSSIVVNTTAVTANSQILVTTDDTLGTKLGVTCNSTVATLVGGLTISARTAGTSFTISNNVAIVTNPLCVSYVIFN